MSKIISFATQKGGSGKSTLTVLTCTAIANRYGRKVLLIDCDPQQTVMDIYARDKANTKYDITFFNWKTNSKNDFRKLLMDVAKNYHYVFLDVPGKIGGEEIYQSIFLSDIVCVPVVPRRADISSTVKFLKTLPRVAEKRKKQGFDFKIYGIPNKLDNTVESTLIGKLNGIGGMQLFENGLSYKIRYDRNLNTSQTIVTSNTPDEFNRYMKEVEKKIML